MAAAPRWVGKTSGSDLSDEAKKIKKGVWSMQRRSSYSNSPDMNQI
jgi:hypothetical protein